MIKSISINFS